MNHYGRWASEHWARWLPSRYAQITDPEKFFSDLGESVTNQVADLQVQLAGPDLPDETYMAKVGRLNMARLQAEEVILSREVYLTPEPGVEDLADEEEEELTEEQIEEAYQRSWQEHEAMLEQIETELAAEEAVEKEARNRT